MADDYGDQVKYKANPYNIDSEKKITASGMRTALGTKEDVANKKDTVANSPTEYPSSKAVYAHTSRVDNPHGVTKAQVGLGSADDTSDLDKPVSTATQTALSAKQDASSRVSAFTGNVSDDTKYPSAKLVYAHTSRVDNPHGVTAAQVGLGSADDTSDLDKPVSTATQAAITAEAALREAGDTAINTALAGKQASLPVGTILMYDGAGWADNSTLPGWYQCNGQKVGSVTLPDLRDKFIRGGKNGNNMARGGTGGADSQSITLQTANLPEHSHGATGLSISGLSFTDGSAASDGAHEHGLSGGAASAGNHQHDAHTGAVNGVDNGLVNIFGQASGVFSTAGNAGRQQSSDGSARDARHQLSINATHNSTGAHTHDFTSTSKASSAGAHTHSVTGTVSGGTVGGSTAATGSGTVFTVDTVPSYYSLIYIRRCA
ncbi:phage tail fiber protein [Candidatus Termititenax persephonae]|uniref:Phage tail fiber protein n=1 Tax=Candidatus Termititenax persephonae TaxID=2218525 RepID=A0A388TIR5_9BACT|nr:phage tail fiber protein [Candidatus Termititenax persephonae]